LQLSTFCATVSTNSITTGRRKTSVPNFTPFYHFPPGYNLQGTKLITYGSMYVLVGTMHTFQYDVFFSPFFSNFKLQASPYPLQPYAHLLQQHRQSKQALRTPHFTPDYHHHDHIPSTLNNSTLVNSLQSLTSRSLSSIFHLPWPTPHLHMASHKKHTSPPAPYPSPIRTRSSTQVNIRYPMKR
jgi:hypothetical protein